MKVVVTGHTSGIGLAISNVFASNGYSVIGFSKSLGYDIASMPSRKDIVEAAYNCDVFVNNAYHQTGQLEMLKEILNAWSGQPKFLINISSQIVNYDSAFPLEIQDYKNSKIKLNSFIREYYGSVNVLNILPGLVHTEFYLAKQLFDTTNGIDPIDLANLIFDVFKHKNNLTIKELTVG
jgi:NADP-dependent 3-hydroxy acid dehydrogenase YdfG